MSRKPHLADAEDEVIISKFKQGLTTSEIAKLVERKPETVRNHLIKAGLWQRQKGNHGPRNRTYQAAPVAMPEPKLVEAGTITMIRGPKRSLWQRIKDFFA